MKTFIVIAIGVAVLLCGLKAAFLWRDSTNVPWLPTGPEPVDPDIRRAWSNVAGYKQSAKVNELNHKAAKWTAATAVAGFVGLVVGVVAYLNFERGAALGSLNQLRFVGAVVPAD